MSAAPAPNEPREFLFPKMEEEMTAYWKKHRIFERSINERAEKKSFDYLDGPPFATGLPHYGHLLQSSIKDAVPRYWTMRGYRVARRWGWDCHGLPVENLVEKELKLGSKKDIEALGIEKFTAACRACVSQYEHDWERYIERLGRWVDFKHSYQTLDHDYIESVWWVFAELHRRELIYKGVRVSLYCPRCATPLSNFEIAMGNDYVEHEDPAIFVKFPVKDEPKTFFLAWTTTPWTLPANTGLAVHPDLMYVAAEIEATGETLIFAEARQTEALKQFYPLKSGGVEFEIVGRWKGRELVGKRYEPLFDFLPMDSSTSSGQGGFRIVTAPHVTADDGTGIVHIAPAFGEEDLTASRANDLPMLLTVDEEGKMVEQLGPFAGLSTKEADRPIIENLQSRGLLYREGKLRHSVPVCYRCSTLLLYKAQPAWFVNVTKLKPDMMKAAKKITWHPAHFKDGRFGNGLASAPDWNISRTRYWGSPLPVWECPGCEKRTIVSSVADLRRLAKPDTLSEPLDLHRPAIDRVVIPCDCGDIQKRVPEVFDCWFESGSMPVASVHYPFENKKWFERHFPADFIAEAQDQTRGWFYTMHVIATALFKKPAAKETVVTGMVLAEDGKKMSKRLKNYPDPWRLMTAFGSDALRYYFLSSSVMDSDGMSFSERDLQNIVRGVLNLLWNVKTFYATYAPDGVPFTKPRSAHLLDRWIFSRYFQLLKEVTAGMDGFDLASATRPIRDFVDDLSTWWLRRSRDRIKSDNLFERADALKTLREILEETAKVIAPFMPFIADKIYLDVGGKKASVHLEKWPKLEERRLDQHLLNDMRWAREVVSKGHDLRTQAKIPLRQALASLTIRFANVSEMRRLQNQKDLLVLIREEVNVEAVALEEQHASAEPWIVDLDTVITPDLKRKGMQREFVRQAMNLRKEAGLQPKDVISIAFMIGAGEARDAMDAGRAVLQKEMKAEKWERVESAPAEFKRKADLKVGGERGELYFL